MASIADLAALAQRMVVLDALGAAIAPATTAEVRFPDGDSHGIGRQRVVALHFETEALARTFIEAACAATKKS